MKMKLRSFTGKAWYEIDREAGTCNCPAFQSGKHCKHLDEVGVYQQKKWSQTTHPTFSQALSGLVKSIRLRRIEDAMYWLLYLDTMKHTQQGARFRIARRLLIGASEDGQNVGTMEKTSENFTELTRNTTNIIKLAAEVVRICKSPNWWMPDHKGGGQSYIFESLIAYRRGNLYGIGMHKDLAEQKAMMENAIEAEDMRTALLAFDNMMRHEGWKRAEMADFLMGLAIKHQNEEAQQVIGVHMTHKGPLSGDANFLGHGVWWLVGGGFQGDMEAPKVTVGEVVPFLEAASERWKNPEPIPAWCCDGIHCGGTDRRFAGMVQDMDALGQAFNYYGEANPDHEWHPEFFRFDGLIIE